MWRSLFIVLGLTSVSLAPAAVTPLRTGSIIGARDESVDVETYLARRKAGGDAGRRAASVVNAVAHLERGCTGWLLTPRYVVTNQHCVKAGFVTLSAPEHPLYDDFTPERCEQMKIRFDYQNRDDDLENEDYARPPKQRFGCARIVLAHQPLDIAIVKLDRPVPDAIAPLRLGRSFRPGERPVFLVGHPAGEPKKIAYRNTVDGRERACVAGPSRFPPGFSGADDPHPEHTVKQPHSFVHTCDSRGGSSGSPLVDAETFAVVGLHWNGWTNCKWPHYHPQGRLDNTNQRRGDRDNEALREANVVSDGVTYQPGNTAIDVDRIRDFILGLPTGEEKGQIPAEVKAAFARQ